MPLAEVPVNCSPGCGDECGCKSDPWHSVQLPVLCIYLLEWFRIGRFAAGSTSGNTAELHPRWRVQSLLWPSACFWDDANLYQSTAFCIRLNSSKIHNSNNSRSRSSIYTATLSPALGYSAPISILSLTFNTLSASSISQAVYSEHGCSSYIHWILLRSKDPM